MTKAYNLRRSRRSQMEILGLAIVVVLILMGIILVFRFLGRQEPSCYRASFVSAELVSNMLSTFLKTSSPECSYLTINELMQDCAQAASIVCGNSMDSCQFVKETAKNVFNQTLDTWHMKYEFTAYSDERNPLVTLGKKCPGAKVSKIFPIPISGSTMYARLEICGNC